MFAKTNRMIMAMQIGGELFNGLFLVEFCCCCLVLWGRWVWVFVSLRFRINIKQVYFIACFLKTELCNSI